MIQCISTSASGSLTPWSLFLLPVVVNGHFDFELMFYKNLCHFLETVFFLNQFYQGVIYIKRNNSVLSFETCIHPRNYDHD